MDRRGRLRLKGERMRKFNGFGKDAKKDMRKREGQRSQASGRTMMVLLGGMMAFCIAAPFILGSMTPYLVGFGRYLPLESRYLGPAVFLLAHLAMIPLFLRKSKD